MSKREPTRRKKKEVRFNLSGQVFMRRQRSALVLAPRSKVHIHTVTLRESWKLIKSDSIQDKNSEEYPQKIYWDTKKRRNEIQPKWPGVYETAEVRFGSCAAL